MALCYMLQFLIRYCTCIQLDAQGGTFYCFTFPILGEKFNGYIFIDIVHITNKPTLIYRVKQKFPREITSLDGTIFQKRYSICTYVHTYIWYLHVQITLKYATL